MSLTDELDQTMASGVDLRAMLDPAASGEVRRIMQICNACRYCEGFCAVFPAMERRRLFTDGDVSYLLLRSILNSLLRNLVRRLLN